MKGFVINSLYQSFCHFKSSKLYFEDQFFVILITRDIKLMSDTQFHFILQPYDYLKLFRKYFNEENSFTEILLKITEILLTLKFKLGLLEKFFTRMKDFECIFLKDSNK